MERNFKVRDKETLVKHATALLSYIRTQDNRGTVCR